MMWVLTDFLFIDSLQGKQYPATKTDFTVPVVERKRRPCRDLGFIRSILPSCAKATQRRGGTHLLRQASEWTSELQAGPRFKEISLGTDGKLSRTRPSEFGQVVYR